MPETNEAQRPTFSLVVPIWNEISWICASIAGVT